MFYVCGFVEGSRQALARQPMARQGTQVSPTTGRIHRKRSLALSLVCLLVHACVRACVRACVCACVCACMHACVRAWRQMHRNKSLSGRQFPCAHVCNVFASSREEERSCHQSILWCVVGREWGRGACIPHKKNDWLDAYGCMYNCVHTVLWTFVNTHDIRNMRTYIY